MGSPSRAGTGRKTGNGRKGKVKRARKAKKGAELVATAEEGWYYLDKVE
jgi:hypothetical protein